MQDWLLKQIEEERKNLSPPDMETVDASFISQALEYWNKGDIMGILVLMSSGASLAFVQNNLIRLLALSKYEETLLHSYIGTGTNWAHWDFSVIKWLFEIADPDKLRAAGDPIPEQDTFTLYRGVSGKGSKRRVNGYSWTASVDRAIWFAKRFEMLKLGDPAVYEVTVLKESILARYPGREEDEYILRLPLPIKPKRISVDLTG